MSKQVFKAGLMMAGVAVAMPLAANAAEWGGAEWNNDGVYVRGEGGWTNIDDNSFATGAGTVSNKYEDDGYSYGAAIGMKKGPMRYELEGLHQESDVKSNSLAGAPLAGSGGTAELNAAMANVYYDFGNGRLKPYIGGGAGIAEMKMDNISGGGATLMDDSDSVLAYQGMAGVSYQLNPCWSVNAEYRYVGTNDAELTTPGGATSKVAYDSNNVMLGLTYKF